MSLDVYLYEQRDFDDGTDDDDVLYPGPCLECTFNRAHYNISHRGKLKWCATRHCSGLTRRYKFCSECRRCPKTLGKRRQAKRKD